MALRPLSEMTDENSLELSADEAAQYFKSQKKQTNELSTEEAMAHFKNTKTELSPAVKKAREPKKMSTWGQIKQNIGITSPAKKYDNYAIYQDEYKDFHEKTKNRLKENGLETRQMRDDAVAKGLDSGKKLINNATEYAMFMMNNEDDPYKQAMLNNPSDNQHLRTTTLKRNSKDIEQETITQAANHYMEQGVLSNDDLLLINKAVTGDELAKNNLKWLINSRKDSPQSIWDSEKADFVPATDWTVDGKRSKPDPNSWSKSVVTTAQNHFKKNPEDRESLRKLFEQEDIAIEKKRVRALRREEGLRRNEFIDSGGTKVDGITFNEDGKPSYKAETWLKTGIHNALDLVSESVNMIPAVVRVINKVFMYDHLMEWMGHDVEYDYEGLEQTFKDISDFGKMQTRLLLPSAPDSEYVQPENLLDLMTSPTHLGKIVLEQGPTMGLMMAGSSAPKFLQWAMTSVYTGSIKNDMLNYELETGEKIPFWKRDAMAVSVGPVVGLLDKLGLDVITSTGPGAILSKKLNDKFKNRAAQIVLRYAGNGTSEGVTEGMQELAELATKFNYRPVTKEEWESLTQSAYAGFVMGMGTSVLSNPRKPVSQVRIKVDDPFAPSDVSIEESDDGTFKVFTYNAQEDLIYESESYETEAEAREGAVKELNRLIKLNNTDEIDFDSDSDEDGYETKGEYIADRIIDEKIKESAEENKVEIKTTKKQNKIRPKKDSLASAKVNLINSKKLVEAITKKLQEAQKNLNRKDLPFSTQHYQKEYNKLLVALQEAKSLETISRRTLEVKKSSKKPRLSRKEKKKRALEGELGAPINEQGKESWTEDEISDIPSDTVEETEPVVADEVVETEPEVDEVVETEEEVESGLKEIEDNSRKEGVELYLRADKKNEYVSIDIKTKKEERGKGKARKAIEKTIEYADKNNITLSLTPVSDFGASKTKLTEFYKSIGFVLNKGKNKDFKTKDTMIRAPKPEVIETPADIKSQDLDTRVNTELTEDEDYVYTADILNGKTGKPLAWVKNLKTNSIDGFTKAARKLQSYIDKHYGSENDQTDMNVGESEAAIQSMEEILEGRDLAFDDDFNIIDLQEADTETDTETDAKQAALEEMDKLGFDILDDGATNMVILPNPIPGMKVVYNGLIKTAQYTYEMLPKKLRQQAENLGITPKNFDATFKSAIDGFKNIPKNIKAWIKKVNKSIKKWWGENKVQIGEKIEQAMARTGGLSYIVEPGEVKDFKTEIIIKGDRSYKEVVKEYSGLLSIENLKEIFSKANQKIKGEKLKVDSFAAQANKLALDLQKELGLDLVSDETIKKAKKTPEDLRQIKETEEYLSDLIVQEVYQEIKDPKSAQAWYSVKMQNAINIIAEIHPEILTDKDAETRFKVALSVTSNGTDVILNTEFGELVYNYYKENGKFPEDWEIYGAQHGAVNEGFKRYNELVEILGESDVNKFLNTEYTIKELMDFGVITSNKGELKGYKVPGAIIFGPKVGGGFYPNLSGQYQYLTMDRWFMRTIGRLRGNLSRTKDYTKQIKGFKKYLKSSKKKLKQYDVDVSRLNDDDYVFDLARLVYRDFAKSNEWKIKPQLKRLRKKYKNNKETLKQEIKKLKDKHNIGTFKEKTSLNAAARALLLRFETKIAPEGGNDRQFMRNVMQRVADKTGLEVADLQAIVWFPEKDLYYSSGIGSKTTKGTDYEQESRKLIDRLRAGRPDRFNAVRKVSEVNKVDTEVKKTDDKFTEEEKAQSLEKIKEKTLKKMYGVEPARSKPEKTSLKHVAAGLKELKNYITKGFNLDYGGGRFDDGVKYLKKQGITSQVYDRYARDDIHNIKVLEKVNQKKGADSVTLMNVLNVIENKNEREFVVQDAYDKLKPGGVMLVQVYEGNKSKKGSMTTIDTWQENRPTVDYLLEIESFIPDAVTRKGKTFVINKPLQRQTTASIEAGFLGFTPSNLKLLKNTIIDTGYFVYDNLPANLQKQGQRIGVTAQNFGRTLSEFSSKTKQNIKAWLKKAQKAMKRWWDDNKVQIGEKIERGMAKMGGIKYAVDPTIEGYQTQLNKLDDKFGKGKGAKKERLKLKVKINDVNAQAILQGKDVESIKTPPPPPPPGTLDAYRDFSSKESKKRAKKNKTKSGILAGVTDFLKNAAMTNSFRAVMINPKIKTMMRRYVTSTMKNSSIDRKVVEPWLVLTKKLTQEQNDWLNGILANSDANALTELSNDVGDITIKVTDKDNKTKKITTNLVKEFPKVRAVLDRLVKRANEVGLDMGYIEANEEAGLLGYYPRIVDDLKALRRHMRKEVGKEIDGAIEQALKNYIIDGKLKEFAKKKARAEQKKLKEQGKERKVSASIKTLTKSEIERVTKGLSDAILKQEASRLRESEKAKIINSLIFNITKGKSGLKQGKSRTITKIDKDMIQYYKGSSDALLGYIDSVNEAIGRQALLKDHYDADFVSIDGDGNKIKDGVTSLVSQTLGGELDADQQEEAIKVLSSVLDVRNTPEGIGKLRAIGYFYTLGDVANTLTQIGDLGAVMYAGATTNPIRMIRNIGKALGNKSDITLRDMHIDEIMHELSDPNTMMGGLNKLFKYTGFKKLDSIAKESFVNTYIDGMQKKLLKYDKLPRRKQLELTDKIAEVFPEGTAKYNKAIADLKAGNLSNEVIEVALNGLMDFQPLSDAELPAYYTNVPNARIAYQLSTWTLRAANRMVEEFALNNKKAKEARAKGNIKDARAYTALAYGNPMRLAAFMMLAGFGKDEVKDLFLGKQTSWRENAWNNFLGLFFMSKFYTDRARERNLIKKTWSGITSIPVVGIANDVVNDIYLIGKWGTTGLSKKESIQYGLETPKAIPWVGDQIYYRAGRGRKSQLTKAKQALKEKGSRNRSRWENKKYSYIKKELRKVKKAEKKSKGPALFD